ncbi:MAG: lysoplasmalogenase [Burkholderiales bacterium]|nr:MAG: lysoplasmalogenase [Burkholderiales bacterium]
MVRGVNALIVNDLAGWRGAARPYALVFLLATVVFVAGKVWVPGFGASFVIKVIPALSLALAATRWPGLARRARITLLAAALLCGAGDVILDLDRGRYFVPGLVAFLLAHLSFIAHFWPRRVAASPRRWGVLAVLIFCAGMTALLWPHLGALRLPVLAYIAVITLMVSAVIMSDAHPLAVAGSVAFMLSDALLAWAKFVSPGWPPQPFNVSVYFLGLGLLGFGALIPPSRPAPT